MVNSWFLFDCIMRLCGLPIRVRIEEAFARDIDIFTEVCSEYNCAVRCTNVSIAV